MFGIFRIKAQKSETQTDIFSFEAEEAAREAFEAQIANQKAEERQAIIAETNHRQLTLQAQMRTLGIMPVRSLITPTERLFLIGLENHLSQKPEEYRIFSKVRIYGDIVRMPSQRLPEKIFKAIASSHMDFVITNEIGEIIVCVELDDPSHAGRTQNDQIKNAIVEAAGIPLVRFFASESYEYERIGL